MCVLPVPSNENEMEDKDTKGTSFCIDNTTEAIQFIETEAECDECLDSLEALFEESDGTDVSDLINNIDEPDEGNPHALLNRQQLEEDSQLLSVLKRKYTSPSPKQQVLDLSPRLESLCVSPRGTSSKRRLFEDSGLGHEAEDSNERVEKVASQAAQPSNETNGEQEQQSVSATQNGDTQCLDILHSNNRLATALTKFKNTFGVGYKELTRPFKSNKTCCHSWVAVIYGVRAEMLEASKTLLKPHCDFFQILNPSMGTGVTVLILFEFASSKCRDTVTRLLCNIFNVEEYQILADPPRHKSVAVALFFYRHSLSNISFTEGVMPDWLKKQTMLNHQQEADTFELAPMVQWAYDNNIWEEAELAYQYACLADVEPNAAAWLKSNNQYKYVSDCAKMVKMYKRYEMRQMSIGQWIKKCGETVDGEGDWKKLINLLKYQDVSIIPFLTSLRLFLKGEPKKNCIVIWGPPDTGKSMFCYSLIRYLQGKVVSYANSKSQFWLQPLTEAKIGLIDDATFPCFQFMDVYMRSGLDGNEVSVDCKHKTPMQVKLPPMLVTSNINVHAETSLKYLHSRLTGYNFPHKLPVDSNGNVVYKITHADWKCFFSKLEQQLDLCEPEDSTDGDTGATFRCCARQTTGAL